MRLFLCLFFLFVLCACKKNKEVANQLPVVSIISPINGAEIEQGSTLQILVEATDHDGQITSLSLLVNDEVKEELEEAPFLFDLNTADLALGAHQLKVIAADNQGGTTSDGVNIQVTPFVHLPLADFSVDKNNITTEEMVQFSDQSTGEPEIWQWSFGDGFGSELQNPTHKYPSAGIYSMFLQVENSKGTNLKIKRDVISVTSNGSTQTVTDIDGNVYNTIKIGNQRWMAENLRTTRYADGRSINKVESESAWDELLYQDKAFSFYDNSEETALIYGAIYNWPAAMNNSAGSNSIPSGVQGVCPEGWHLPSDAEWLKLVSYLDGSEGAALKLRSASSIFWYGSSVDADNESGFNARAAGYRQSHGAFSDLGSGAGFWSSTSHNNFNAYHRFLYSNNPDLEQEYANKNNGFSVRCIKN